jgi:nucleoredoxin
MAEQASNCWVDLLGPELLKKEETVQTATALQGKFVALYFSAHWCGPCRGFTPQLAEQYKKIVGAGKNWEVVFCSSDSDDNAFKSYYKEMPWLALPYAKRDLKEKLSGKYGVRGIPTLVLLNESGELITTGGRGKVMDESGFPWLPIPFEKCFGSVLADSNATAPMDNFDINKGVKGLYFSAHWCGPCRGFTPNLVQVYKQVKAQNKDFEIVFVTSDRDQESFKSYFSDMPWTAISFDKKAERESIEEKFGVEGIPALVMLQDGKLLNKSAVGNVRAAGGDPFNASEAAAAFPFKEEAVQELSKGTAGNLNECPCLILFQDKELAADVQKTNASFLENAAKAELDSALSGNERKMAYYTHNKENELTQMMHKMMTELASENKMVILHFGGQGAYYVADLPTSEADVNKFVADFHAGKLTRKQANPPR